MKHHFEECVERVTGADEEKPVDKKHPNEDCVEECKCHLLLNCSNAGLCTNHHMIANIRLIIVFHLAHCATQCAAPKLWSVLK